MWKYIVTPIIGAIIGYVTNWIRYFFLHQNPCNAGGSTPVYSKVKNLLYNPACLAEY